MTLLAFDTATPATVVGVATAQGQLVAERRHEPAPGERPGHAPQLLALCDAALGAAGASWGEVTRVGVGLGPGTFTGLRIGVATARALAQGLACEVVGVSTLEALARGARAGAPAAAAAPGAAGAAGAWPGAVLAVLDARRGEAFVASWDAAGRPLLAPAAWPPERLPEALDPALGPWLAVGDGAVRFRQGLEGAATVPEDGAPVHRVGAAALCRLAAEAPPADRDRLLPTYIRTPDAVPRR